MKRALTINGTDHKIEIFSKGQFRFDSDAEREAQVETPEPNVYSILLEGRVYEARVEETIAGLTVIVDGHRFEIAIRDPRRWSRNTGSGTAEGIQTIFSPMPGKVVRVLVAPGDSIEAGEGVVVVEAMKMQNEMKALRAGRVAVLTAVAGATVNAGEILAAIE